MKLHFLLLGILGAILVALLIVYLRLAYLIRSIHIPPPVQAPAPIMYMAPAPGPAPPAANPTTIEDELHSILHLATVGATGPSESLAIH